MSENTKIEWCDHTWSPWEGCQKVGPGCDHCYAEARNARFAGGMAVNWGAGAPRRRTAPNSWKLPMRWDRKARELGKRLRIFPSLCDPFDNAVDPAWRRDLFELIARTPNLDWLLLTKRIGNARDMLNEVVGELSCGLNTWDELSWPNVWLGATIVNQEEADRDIEKLLMTPARCRFLSMEPLLGPVDLRAWFDPTGVCCMQEMQSCADCPADAPWIHGPTTEYAEDGMGYSSPKIDWVIVGGESGADARPMHPEWARNIRDQCMEYGVPFMFKQWGGWKPVSQMDETRSLYRSNRIARDGEDQAVIDDLYGTTCKVAQLCLRIDGNHVSLDSPNAFLAGTSPMQAFNIGKRAAGRLLDGRTHDEFPEA